MSEIIGAVIVLYIYIRATEKKGNRRDYNRSARDIHLSITRAHQLYN